MLAAVSAVKNYLQKTTQSLTGVIEVQLTPNAWLPAAGAARLGDTTLAERYFRQAAEIDLADNMGNAAGGVHAGALGGLWQAAVLGFAGLRFCGESPDEHRETCHRAGAACRCAFSGGVDGTSSRFQKVRSRRKRRMIHERTDHPRSA
jgi:hypothetical protein